jgi:hypothetical protein
MLAIGGARNEVPLGLATQSPLAHQPSPALVTLGVGAWRLYQTRTTVGSPAIDMDRT